MQYARVNQFRLTSVQLYLLGVGVFRGIKDTFRVSFFVSGIEVVMRLGGVLPFKKSEFPKGVLVLVNWQVCKFEILILGALKH